MKRDLTAQRRGPGKAMRLLGCIALALLLLFTALWFTLRQSGSDGQLADAVRQDDFPGVKDALARGANANLRAGRYWDAWWRVFWKPFVRLVPGNEAPVLWIAMERAGLNNNIMGPSRPEKMQADADIFEALLAAHADPNSRIDPGHRINTDNLLYYALNGRLTPIALSLLKHGAPLPSQAPPLQSVLLFDNSPEVLQALLRAGVDVKGEAGKQALVNAYQQSWSFPDRRKDALATFQILLDAGVDPNALDPKTVPSGSLLYDAVMWKHLDVVPMLLRAHADPRIHPKSDMPLLYRALDGSPALFQMLLEAGVDANTHESTGEPLLWYVVIHQMQESEADKVRKVQLLLQHGADVRAKFNTSGYGNVTVPEAAHRDARDGHIAKPILDLLDQAVKAGAQPAAPPTR